MIPAVLTISVILQNHLPTLILTFPSYKMLLFVELSNESSSWSACLIGNREERTQVSIVANTCVTAYSITAPPIA